MGLTEFLISFVAVNNFKVCLGYRCHCSVNYDLSYFKKEIGIKPADRHPGMVIKSWQDDFFSACM